MTSKITELLEILSDGEWHTLAELRRQLNTEPRQFSKVVSFLVEYEFIMLDEAERKAHVSKAAQKLLSQKAATA